MIDDFLIIPSVIAQILYPTAELAVPIATQNAEIETQPLITKKKKKKKKKKRKNAPSKPKPCIFFYAFDSLNVHALFF